MAFTFPPTWKLQPKVSAIRSNTTIAVMLQSAHIDKLMLTSCADIAHNPHKCGKELLLQSTVRASPLQLMRCQHWSRFIYHRNCIASHTWRFYRERSLQCCGHSSVMATPTRLPSDCIATELASWLRFWPELVSHHRCTAQKQTLVQA